MTALTRRQLYELVWSKPMRAAAAEIGISNVGLKKVCVRHRVPVPPQGYWNKVHASQTPPRAALTDSDDKSLNRIVIESAYSHLPVQGRRLALRAAANEKAPENKIRVDANRRPCHAKAVALASVLEKAKPNAEGLLEVLDPNLFYVKVAPQSIDRAVAIVDALLDAAAARGMTVRPGGKQLGLAVKEEIVELRLTEEVRWVSEPPTAREIAAEARRERAARAEYGEHLEWLYRPAPRPGAYQPQGRLTMELVNKEHGVPGRWRDTSTRRLETLLNRLLKDVMVLAATAEARRQEKERRDRQWRLEEERQARQKAREELLEEQLQTFAQLERLERYLRRLDRSMDREDVPRMVHSYLTWCRRQAKELRATCSAAGIKQALTDWASERLGWEGD